MADERKVFDLDEVFGKNASITVRWQEKEYQLKGVTALGPAELAGWKALDKEYRRMLTKTSKSDEDLSEEEMTKVMELMDKILALIAPPELANDPTLGFIHKSRLLEYYMQESGLLNSSGGQFRKR